MRSAQVQDSASLSLTHTLGGIFIAQSEAVAHTDKGLGTESRRRDKKETQ